MAIPKDRYVCTRDLLGYFAKKDLLNGLTELEKIKLRQNIGILNYTGEGGQSIPVEITYSALSNLISTNSLIVGARYIITDFQTIYSSNVLNGSGKKITWGLTTNPSPITRLLVIANTSNRLDHRVLLLVENAKDWVVEYDVTQELLEDGAVTKGKITYLMDENGNSAYYDFKSVKFRRTAQELQGSNVTIIQDYVDLFTFSDIIDGFAIDNSNYKTTKYNLLKKDCWNNVFIGDTYNNNIEANCRNNTFLRGCHDVVLGWNSVSNLFNETVCYSTGSVYNKIIQIGDTSLSTSISKIIQKVNDVTIVSYLDVTTYAWQITILK